MASLKKKQTNSLKLYAFPLSAPSRSVHMTMSYLNLKADYISTNPLNGETKTPEFLELNRQHSIPVLKVGDTAALSDSRAIVLFLAEKYSRSQQALENQFYPTDPSQRAIVHERIWFDATQLYPACFDAFGPIMFGDAKYVPKEKMAKVDECLKWVQDMVRKGYSAGGQTMTVADVVLMASISTLKACGIVDVRKYNFIESWFNRCQNQIPDYELVNGNGAKAFGELYREQKAKNASVA